MKFLAALLLLALATPAHAGTNFYEYLGIQILEPKTCTSPCHVTWRVELRGLPLLPLIKRCPGGPDIETDEYLTIYASGANLPQGTIRLTIGDTHPWDDMHPAGRTQVFCARLMFMPLPPEQGVLKRAAMSGGVTARCLCGCGLPAPLTKRTRRKAGYRKGDVLRYRRGHAHRVTGWGIATGFTRAVE